MVQKFNTSAQIIHDLLTEQPHYTLHSIDAIIDRSIIDLLKSCIKTRMEHGVHALDRKLASIKQTREDIYNKLTSEPVPQPQTDCPKAASMVAAIIESSMPALPASARCDVGLLATVSPWLKSYIDYSRQASPEGYKDFHLGCGLWVLSTVAARRVHVPLSDPVFTPLSLVMVARTSLFAKSTTAKAGTKLLRAAGLHHLMGDDETTPQRLLYDMAGHMPPNWRQLGPDEQDIEKARLAFSAQRGWYYDEIGQLLNAMAKPNGPMADFAGLLRKLDNCEEDYRYSTKTGGKEHIKNPYLSLLGNTTPANLSRYMGAGSEMWGDGFWARVLFICPDPHGFVTQTMTRGSVYPDRTLIDPLRAWHKRLGIPTITIGEREDTRTNKPTGELYAEVDPLPATACEIDDAVLRAFDAYRLALREIIATRIRGQDLDGSYARLPTQALRIATLIASLEHNNHITIDVWALAQEIAEVFRANLHSLYQQVAEAPEENPVEDLLIEFLKTLSGKTITVREISRKAPAQIRKLKSHDIRDMLKDLERDGTINSSREGKVESYGLVS